MQELEVHLDDERRVTDDLRNQLSVSERRRVAMGQELEDARSALEQVRIPARPPPGGRALGHHGPHTTRGRALGERGRG